MGGCQSSEAAAVSSAPNGSSKSVVSTRPETSKSVPSNARKVLEPLKQQPDKGAAPEKLPGARPPLIPGTNTQSESVSIDDNMRGRFASYASGASTPELHSSDDDSSTQSGKSGGNKERHRRQLSNPKALSHSTSAIGLDTMIEDRREVGDLRQNVVHIEVPFGKPIEEVYDGIHNGPVLGSGISGLVRLVTHKKTGLKYAVKVLDLALVETAEGLRQLREEIFIMCQLDHPNIVRLEEVYESHSEIYLVQELCLGGELFDRLDEQPDYHYTEAECARLVKQMLSAVRYLHSRGIIHRDLKLENFLFSSTDATDSELKMIDFGLSKHFHFGEEQHEAVGTPYTVAPEVIRGRYDERCDIWAIGVIAFLLLSGEPPFGGCGGPEPLMTVRANILSGSYQFSPPDIWSQVSKSARDFIRELLVTDPQKRPTARSAQKHPWLQEWASRSRTGDDHALNPNVVKALVNFKEYSDMRKLLCEVLSFTLLPDQIKDLRREFEKMDTDGSGEISLSALKQVLMTNAGAGSLGALTEEEVEDIFNAMRVRKSETRIHWHEFIAAGLSQCSVDDRNLRLAFDRLDSDHKGYITLDDIMDVMGSDALQSEEAMREMWGDSMKAVKCQHARITYDDFLLLMKGQSKENPSVTDESDPGINFLLNKSQLNIVSENEVLDHPDELPVNVLSLERYPVEGLGTVVDAPTGQDAKNISSCFLPTQASESGILSEQPKHLLGLELDFSDHDGPLTMDDDDHDILSSGPGVPGCAASLTPPSSPQRGAQDYCTPLGARRTSNLESEDKISPNLLLPGLSLRPSPYTRRRSRSVDDKDTKVEEKESADLHEVADVVRDMVLPETRQQRTDIEAVLHDSTKSALVVNRQLYRAHRQMRLAVLEASKRFEEQQTAHARDLILAQREAEGNNEHGHVMIQAGLVMRHGHKKQVSSEAIRTLLLENQAQQQALVEKANRRGGRGRRSRKKTISDMSGMMGSSIGQHDVSKKNDSVDNSEPIVLLETSDPSSDGRLRGPTVPGEFRQASDPFGQSGKYGLPLNAGTALNK
ncbi:hypothetical protein FisN_20Hh280 [Fistulifera solaris]|uniref:Calmodulin n=1 Tax=Fistulifera solaris TaxID=1519565 RepID=A0A1Z5JQ77_FISSO|nr:hypothetical protein FisN_20Hh280 [Fistulifera solaris]|eukprot:GAX16046.1 hypothetical protein FisN_20Hh280 [Fistulifera solaris]